MSTLQKKMVTHSATESRTMLGRSKNSIGITMISSISRLQMKMMKTKMLTATILALILQEKLGGPKASVILSNVQNNMSVVMTCLKLCDWLGFAATFRTKMAGYPIPELARSEDSRWCVHDLKKMHHLRKGSKKTSQGN